ncbi:hypothetical protein [Carnimonas bestiolae]|uniref:hypothetical protein n=1 Tax=Carnimonas bestiolae TaxID=3402172 RepID=UPI003EDC84BD
MNKPSLWFSILLALPFSGALAAEQAAADGHEQQAEHSSSSAAEAKQEAAKTSDDSSAAEASKTNSESAASDDSGSASQQDHKQEAPSDPQLSPTEYVNALLPSLTVARDLGRNCHVALEKNSDDKKVCNQFDRGLKNLAAKQKDIESKTPRPSDTSSVDPQLMKRFNAMQDDLRSETEYLRAYRATQ